ncbi:MAG: RNA methyltransferase [Bdellovibrionales bacterium]|nr:RNA methyltransferase [Bdellovibrionales bacterium]
MSVIESSRNSHFKIWLSLLEGKGLKKHRQFLLMGRKLVPEFLKERAELFTHCLYSNKNENLLPLLPESVTAQELSPALFKELDLFATNFPLLVGKIPEIPVADLQSSPRGIEALSALGNPANQGAFLRSCEAFGVTKVILLEEACSPFHPKALRASSGSSLRLDFVRGPSVAEVHSPSLVALDLKGQALPQFSWPKDVRLLLGEEGPGVPKTSPIEKITIPMMNSIESLNAVAAASIALYSYRSQHPLSK